MKKIYLLFLTYILFGCGHENSNQKIIETAIDKNKDKVVFLSFWKGMSDEQFKKVKRIEYQKGNLIKSGNYFSLKSPHVDSTVNVQAMDFKILKINGGIELRFNEEIKVPLDIKDKNNEKYDALQKGKYYQNAERYLIKYFTEKYEPYKPDFGYLNSGFDYKQWISKNNSTCTVITFESDYYYYDFKSSPDILSHINLERKIVTTAEAMFSIKYETCKSLRDSWDEKVKDDKEKRKMREKIRIENKKHNKVL